MDKFMIITIMIHLSLMEALYWWLPLVTKFSDMSVRPTFLNGLAQNM